MQRVYCPDKIPAQVFTSIKINPAFQVVPDVMEGGSIEGLEPIHTKVITAQGPLLRASFLEVFLEQAWPAFDSSVSGHCQAA